MRYRAVTRLAIHLLGIYVILGAVSDMVRFVAFNFDPDTPGSFMWRIGYPAITGLRILIGLYLALRGGVLLNLMIQPGRIYCPHCGLHRGRRAVAQACDACGFSESDFRAATAADGSK